MVSIRKRGKKWVVDYYEIDGRRVQKVVAHTKPVAQMVAAEIKTRIDRQKWGLPTGREVKARDFIDEFIKHIKAEKSPKTALWYEHKLRRFAQFIGKKTLPKVLPKDIEDFKIERLSEVTAATVAGDLRTLKTFFNRAIDWGYIERNPCRGVKAPRMISHNPPIFLNKEEVRKLLDAAQGSRIFAVLATGLYAGLRFGEMLRLEWKDIDFSQGLINVRSKAEGHTKSHKGRVLPLAPKLEGILQAERNAKGYCFWQPEAAYPYDAYRRELRRVRKKAGIRRLGWHTLRHTFASHLVMAGVDLTTVKELLGHSSITTTMIYAHLAPEHLRGAVERLRY